MGSQISLKNISLTYPVYGMNARSFKASLIHVATGGRLDENHGHVMVEALNNVNFQLDKGDRLALIGPNGAGKSSLLKVLAQIYEPTHGNLQITGRSNCLFDIMMGMDHELNGYENVILRGIILGLSKTQARAIIPQVEEFADLGDFMGVPIKTYSAGMKLRLAYGIITSIVSEILLIDEIVNIGDARFIEKAKSRMKSLIHQSEIMVLATHDIQIVKELCNKALWLEKGKVKCFGPIDEVLKHYEYSEQVAHKL